MSKSRSFLEETLEDFRAILKRVYNTSGSLTDYAAKVKAATAVENSVEGTPSARLARRRSADLLAEADRNDALIRMAVARVFMSMPQDLSVSLRRKSITQSTPFGSALVAELATTPANNAYGIEGLAFNADAEGPWNNLAAQIAEQGETFRERYFVEHPGLDGFEL